ncbi:hypothetical protein H072_8745 [Dactylellina haptotyla CBS 200.50]|uniref:Outer spore wall protein RRT8 n=1 Tax=Dactylellina haptotyla (strain CBS 200.50) TaxID=1284197 RepID=S8A8X8_DACHA|nr:hypothetical protein H072_8745 [Dactylellina haptotyla CBS 200.50]
MSTSERVKTVVQQEANQALALSKDAAQSGTYMFPIQGIYHFLRYPSLQRPLWSKLLPTILLSVTVITVMFFVTYLPQVAILALVDGPIAFFNAAMLVLSESSTLILLISKWWWMDDATVEVFDAVLVQQNQTSLVAAGRELKPTNSADPISKLGKRLKKPFVDGFTKSLIRYVVLLPLNLIPIFGTMVFFILNARNVGPAQHARYFQLKGFSDTERTDFVKKNQGAYVGFGLSCVLLNLIPLANIVFAFTHTVGAALWAAKMENMEVNRGKKTS